MRASTLVVLEVKCIQINVVRSGSNIVVLLGSSSVLSIIGVLPTTTPIMSITSSTEPQYSSSGLTLASESSTSMTTAAADPTLTPTSPASFSGSLLPSFTTIGASQTESSILLNDGPPNGSGKFAQSTDVPPSATTSPGDPTNGQGGSDHGKGHLSVAVIAVIVIVAVLILIFLTLTGVRIWYRKRRGRRIRRWNLWRKRVNALGFFGQDAGQVNDTEQTLSCKERMTPSMLEDASYQHPKRSSAFFSLRSSLSSLGAPLRTANAGHRTSSGSSEFSFISNNSENSLLSNARASTVSSAQYMPYPTLQPDKIDNPQISPISVRPWTPSEAWRFPKPPMSVKGLHASESNARDFGGANQEPLLIGTSESEKTIRGGISNPFADPEGTTPLDVSHRESVLSMTRSDSAAFSDMAASRHASLLSTAASEFSSMTSASETLAGIVDTIKRKFTPSSEDELNITRGDQICILRRFDDGWLYVEKTATAEKGFIPQDCLREIDKPLPSYFARRASNFNACAI